MSSQSKKVDLSSTLKSQDTEEWLDIHFTRPLGLLWARFFARFDVHPNVVTVLSIILGVAAAVLFYFPSIWLTIAGILLLVWANIYDSADGQLARMTGKKTMWGRILDGFAGDIWFFCIYFSLCLRLDGESIPFTSVSWGIWIWLLACFSGFVCHAQQCRLADYYRNVHLYFLKAGGGSELVSFAKLRVEFASLNWRKDWAWMTFLYFYVKYTRAQEQATPAFQRFFGMLQAKYGEGGELPEALRTEFRTGSLPLMKYANILTFNSRAIVLYLGLLLNVAWVYFLFEVVVLNVLYYYVRARHERLCRELYEKWKPA